MSNAYFFSENWMKEYTPVSQTVDYEDIKPFIEQAGDQLARPKIGTVLYERLKASIVATDYSADELVLIKLLRPALCNYTVYLALPFLQSKIRNKGIVRGTDQFISTISRQDMLDLRQEFLQLSGYYMSKVSEYLCDNGSLFPQYTATGSDKTIYEDFDFGGFLPFKGYALGGDTDLILKAIGYKRG